MPMNQKLEWIYLSMQKNDLNVSAHFVLADINQPETNMRSCPNCGAQITCGCQDRTASDGTRVCSNCAAFYEQQLAAIKQSLQQNENTPGQ